MFRGVLGTLLGLAIVSALPSYGGIGVNLLLVASREEVPPASHLLYLTIAAYSLIVVAVLLILAILTFAEFTAWRIKDSELLVYGTVILLAILAILHLAAFFGIASVRDPEAKNLFIDGSVAYAILLLVAVGLFLGLRRSHSVAPIESK